MMKWKAGIRHAGDLPDLTTQLAKNRRRHRPTDAAPGIDDHFEWTSQLGHVVKQTLVIRRHDFIALHLTARLFPILVSFHLGANFLDLLAVERVLAETDLKAVVFGRIVAGRDLNPAVDFEMEQRKIEQRAGTNADVVNVKSGASHAGNDRFGVRV